MKNNDANKLIDACYHGQLDAMYVSEMNINELYLVGPNGWEPTTPEKLKVVIENKGPQNVVLQCTTHDMSHLKNTDRDELDRTFLESGKQEFTGVDKFEYSNGNLLISSEDAIICSLDIHEAWLDRIDLEYSKIHIISDEEQAWLDSKSWDGNADQSWDDRGYR